MTKADNTEVWHGKSSSIIARKILIFLALYSSRAIFENKLPVPENFVSINLNIFVIAVISKLIDQ